MYMAVCYENMIGHELVVVVPGALGGRLLFIGINRIEQVYCGYSIEATEQNRRGVVMW